mgnify:CR=1 FL=1
MKKSIGEFLGKILPIGSIKDHPSLLSKSFIGIEVEVEGYNRQQLAHWDAIEDGSLRNSGVEFVLSKPLAGAALVDAIEEIDNIFSRKAPSKSFRTSTHIHVDVTDMYYDEYIRFVLALYSFEPLFFAVNSVDRTSSNFCLPLKKSQGLIKGLSHAIEPNRGLEPLHSIDRLSSCWPKYSSINLASTQFLGTIELRCYECMTDKESLLNAINRLLVIKNLSQEFEGSYRQFLKHIKGLDYSKFFGNSFDKGFEFNRKDVNIRLLQDAILLRRPKIKRGAVRRVSTTELPTNEAAAREHLLNSREFFVRDNPWSISEVDNSSLAPPPPAPISLSDIERSIAGTQARNNNPSRRTPW